MASDLLDRYLSGDCEAVWDELTTVGALREHDEMWATAHAITREMMQRVKQNIKTLVWRWQSLGFRFGDGFLGDIDTTTRQVMLNDAPTYGFTDERQNLWDTETTRLEEVSGGLPIALHYFYREVGSVNFVGTGPIWREYEPPHAGDPPLLRGYTLSPYGSDPLFVWSPKVVFMFHPTWQQMNSLSGSSNDNRVSDTIDIAPDFNFKFGTSGSGTYEIRVPCAAVDAPLEHEWHQTSFVNYLRIGCHWGGFPGLEYHRDKDRLVDVIRDITHDLVPF